MIVLTNEEAKALRDRIKGGELSDTSYAFLRGMAKLTDSVGRWEPIGVAEPRCGECDQSPCICLELDLWRATL
jgi:hypothetical protein